jgi:hypothetical protein
MHPLDSASRKMERACQHLRMLTMEVNAFLDRNPQRVTRETDAENALYIYHVYAEALTAPPHRFGMIAADAVHNMRSALDHAAWQLALLRTAKPNRSTAFPIFTERNDRAFCRMVCSMPIECQVALEAIQPYHGEHPRLHLLAILHRLWNMDKHRAIPMTLHRFNARVYTGPGGSHEWLDNGDVVIRVPIVANPEANLEPYFRPSILFGGDSADDAVGLDVLWKIHRNIRDGAFPVFLAFLPKP